MADNASVIWTGDTTFDLNLAGESTTQACLITTLYKTWHSTDGPIAASGSLRNASYGYLFGVSANQTPSRAWGGVLHCTGRDSSAYIEEVYILFGTTQQTRQRAVNIANQYASSQSVSYVNSYIQSQSWTYILGRQQAEPLPTPTGLYADNITSDSATTHWTGDANASNYKVQYKAAGDTVWTETFTD